ncbi:hypothetical protein [Paenibacillus sp. DCT19]|uniref:hypothetical protein n=1 Tax=Paenibacillus sp. DCT19 TaxID=2211212 RepID=UPI000FE1E4B5|nr:hypothetical protein [Paenibacillus sp. DCT19]
MRRISVLLLCICMIYGFTPPALTEAAKASTTIKTAVHMYKGQPYVQISGGNPAVTKSINKILKEHTVKVVDDHRALQQHNRVAWSITSVKTLYNNQKLLSIVYTDGINYTDDNVGTYISSTYNFDLTTGKRITLSDVVDTEFKKANLMSIISQSLQLKYDKGIQIIEKRIYEIPSYYVSEFYYYNKGIVVRFHPTTVAEAAEGFIDVIVPYDQLSDRSISQTVPKYLNYLRNHVSDYNETEMQYFDGYKIGNIYALSNGEYWRQVEPRFYSIPSDLLLPKVRIYKDRTRYYMWVDGTDDAVEVERLVYSE